MHKIDVALCYWTTVSGLSPTRRWPEGWCRAFWHTFLCFQLCQCAQRLREFVRTFFRKEQSRADNARIAAERDKALATVARLEDADRRRLSRLKLIPLPRAARQIGAVYKSYRRLCAAGLVEGARKTGDGLHWLVDVNKLAIAGLHHGLIYQIDGAGGA